VGRRKGRRKGGLVMKGVQGIYRLELDHGKDRGVVFDRLPLPWRIDEDGLVVNEVGWVSVLVWNIGEMTGGKGNKGIMEWHKGS
jgi:hypothetical protein